MSIPYSYENHLHEHEARWFAVYTRYKREKQVHRFLQQKGIESYLPLREVTHHYRRKVRVANLPLINCYLFTKVIKREYVSVLETPDVVKFVQFSRNLISIPEAEIKLLQRVVGDGRDVLIEQREAYQTGDRVEIIGGDLTGLQGMLLDKMSEKRFLLELDRIGYSLRLDVDSALLRKL